MKTTLVFLMMLMITLLTYAQPVKRLYIANDDHTDYMWAGNEAKYDSAFVHMLDFYLKKIDETRNEQDDFQTRFNCDGSYWIKIYQKYRSPGQFKNLIANIRDGHISSPLNLLVSTYGAQPTEAVLRGMMYAGKLERDYNLKFDLAVAMENQTLPLGLSSLWAGSGALYSWRGVCGCATRLTNESLASRQHQLYYYSGHDSSKVLMKWYNRAIYNGRTLGGYAETRRAKAPADPTADLGAVIHDLDKMCDTIRTDSNYPYNVAAAFGYGWDDLETFNARSFTEAAKKYSTPLLKVRVSNEADFFRDMIKSYPKFPSEAVSYGNEWDVYCASMNETTAKVRRSTEKLRSAEALAVLVSIKIPDFDRKLLNSRNNAWDALGMYWEHDWTADAPSVSQRERSGWQTKLQKNITGYVDTLFDLAKRKLGEQLRISKYPRFYVFNSLSWTRNDFADIAYNGALPVKVVDLQTGLDAASQVITKEGHRYIRLEATRIPPVGYKVYEIRKGSPAKYALAAGLSGEYFSNRFYKIRIKKSGVITAIYDKLHGNRQLVKALNGRYVNDLGTHALNNGHGLVIENSGPVSVTVKAISADPLLHTVRVTLYHNSNRIDLENSIDENFKKVKLWSFSLDMHKQTTRHEELGAILTVKKRSDGGDYADQNARYDWQTFNHFADLSENKYGLTISNVDCSFFKLGNSTADSLCATSSQINALAGGQVDPYTLSPKGWKDTVMMGIYNQAGEKKFDYHFALQTHAGAFDQVSSMKFAMEHQNPLVCSLITGSTNTYPETEYSFLAVKDPGVLLWSVKPAEDGIKKSIIARFWNLNQSPVNPVISTSFDMKKVWKSTHIETDIEQISNEKGFFSPHFNKQQINTYRIIY